ncbi:hypothetical protein MUN82_14035 [Hymenobacter aerilatus]|uniref:Bacterial alpha-2-macroglobulin MG10 domain-containing protein n=1 Tax=Hymenobacter aerilatus TaxID=2932251 RepID=A0A8T9SRT8_9BACT|nr:hypothetical protein [Hymenobacter aerilatus]UOR04061.1 hypothetical protein MUN82_14035 [Hymenobacter aerilatus]
MVALAVRDLTWATNAAHPDYLAVRDDRLNLFATGTARPKAFYYLARAVSTGTFKLGPVTMLYTTRRITHIWAWCGGGEIPYLSPHNL